MGPRLRALMLNCFMTRRITFWLTPNCFPISACLRSGRPSSTSATRASKLRRTPLDAGSQIYRLNLYRLDLHSVLSSAQARPVRAFKSMGRTAPRRFSLWGYSTFADAAPTETRTTGACIHCDNTARSAQRVSGGSHSEPPAASLALAPAEPQFRCRASRPPSGPRATPSSLGMCPRMQVTFAQAGGKCNASRVKR